MKLNAQRLRDARKAAGLTRAQLFLASGVSIETIARVELGKGSPRAEHLAKIAAALDVPMDSLFDPEKVA